MDKPTTKVDSIRTPDGKLKKGVKLNPTGKGGFQDRPEDRSPGGWKKENTISYQYKRFLNMTPDELKEFGNTPASERTVAMDIAYSQVLASRKSLPHTKEITDRTEGKAPQSIDITSDGEPLKPLLVEFIGLDASNGQNEDPATS